MHHFAYRDGVLHAEAINLLHLARTIGTPFYCGVHWASAAKLDPARLIPEGFRKGYTWRWRDRSVGGGLVQDHLPHYVDLVRHWIASQAPVFPGDVQAPPEPGKEPAFRNVVGVTLSRMRDVERIPGEGYRMRPEEK